MNIPGAESDASPAPGAWPTFLERYASIVQNAIEGIFQSTPDGQYLLVNPALAKLYGYESPAELIASVQDISRSIYVDATVREEFKRLMAANGEVRGLEYRVRRKDGGIIWISEHARAVRDEDSRVLYYEGFVQDITAKKQLEEQFLRVQRMEGIGMLAAGIAHDLNNVLTPILMVAPILRDRVTDPGDIKMLGALEKSAERGAALVRQILGFAQGVGGVPQIVQVRHIIKDMSNVIRETFPKNIHFEEQIADELWAIRANPTHIHQILLNLCVNARDAMPQGGTLRLKAENCVLDELAAMAIDDARSGAWIVIDVEDTGTGIPPDVLTRIWEPFFTTKETGKGTGLGLSTVRGIVKSHNGFMTVRTRPGCGTTFRSYLPATEDSSEADPSAHPFPSRGNGELILVVDDEPNVREITATILARHGYRVLVAADGPEAVALFGPRRAEVRLVVTDVNMPDLDGAAVANVVRRINPSVKILAISGMETGSHGATKPHPFADIFLSKPFKVATLLASVQRLLGSDRPAGRD
jgi:two-component system cell cycle sensor histidine kinase/response regulator CckA